MVRPLIRPKDDPAADYWPVVKHLLTTPPRQLTQSQLLRKWPHTSGVADPLILDACLSSAVADGRILQAGTGRRGDPVRYFIDGLDAIYEPDVSDILDTARWRESSP